MARRATTIRLNPAAREGLNKLSEILHRPVNTLVNEAVRDYVDRRSSQVEDELSATLADLRKLRQRDPSYKRAAKEFIDGEAVTQDDPAEGIPAAPTRRKAARPPNA